MTRRQRLTVLGIIILFVALVVMAVLQYDMPPDAERFKLRRLR